MALGSGIFLIVIGAILAFAIKDSWDAVDLTVVGYICIAAGALAIIISPDLPVFLAGTHP